VVADSHSDLHFIRVYSGTLKAGSRLVNVGRNLKENLPKLFRVFAKRRDAIEKAHAGDIVAAIGLKQTLTGDTLCEQHGKVLLERIEFPERVISMAIEPASSADRDKLINALKMLARSDPTFDFRVSPDTSQLLISGMGELHLEVMCHRLERDMKVKVRVGKPRVAYRETITKVGEAEGRLIRQTGGKGQYAVVKLRVERFTPGPGGESFQFESQLRGGAIRETFIPAIEQGAKSAASSGPLGAYPLINVKATLLDGAEHAEDSSDIAFEAAASMAFHQAVEAAGPVLLEPIMKVEIVTPEEYFGPINSDLGARRATITATTIRARAHVIDAEAPLSAMFGYATTLRSLSQGRAAFSMEPLKYAAMPAELAKQVLGH
jgi:elongation factor G